MKIFTTLFVLLIILVAVQAYTISLLDENLEVASLIIISTEHQRDEARRYADELADAVEACRSQEPQLWRGPYYPEQEPQQNQEDTSPLSC